MWLMIITFLLGIVILVISTDQFVIGASRVADGLRVSSVLVGAVILGCGTGLPELALAFHSSRTSPWLQLIGVQGDGSHSMALLMFTIALVFVLSIPALFPDRVTKHSPVVLLATIMFASLLRGALDRVEGAAMLVGFAIGIAWIIHNDKGDDFDPFAPIIEDAYQPTGAYIEAPVMTPVQVEALRSFAGLFGTALGAQLMGYSGKDMLHALGATTDMSSLVFVFLGSVLPHVVVAIQAIKQHHEGLAVGNMIGSNLFHSLAIGGLVSIIRPYQSGDSFGILTLGLVGFTALLTWMLLRTGDELSRKQGLGLLVSYIGIVLIAVR